MDAIRKELGEDERGRRTVRDFSPEPDAKADAAVDLFQVRMQDFAPLASEIRRFTSTIASATRPAACCRSSSQLANGLR